VLRVEQCRLVRSVQARDLRRESSDKLNLPFSLTGHDHWRILPDARSGVHVPNGSSALPAEPVGVDIVKGVADVGLVATEFQQSGDNRVRRHWTR